MVVVISLSEIKQLAGVLWQYGSSLSLLGPAGYKLVAIGLQLYLALQRSVGPYRHKPVNVEPPSVVA